MERSILHCDMNNFFASVECRLNPALKAYPVAVCGSVEDRHGIVLAKNQKAKACGVATAEPVWQAKEKCPGLVVVPPHYEEYLKFSRLAQEIYLRFSDQVEPFGMDECWLDVTGSQNLFGNGEQIAQTIRRTIKRELGLTISAGVSFNKVFAKLGSDLKKPDAVTCISRESFREQIWPLPAGSLLGVGASTQKALRRCRVFTIGDLAHTSPATLKLILGKNGVALWHFANGEDASPVQRFDYESPVKSIGHGITAVTDLNSDDEVFRVMLALFQEIGHKLRLHQKLAAGVSIHIKNSRLATRQWQRQLDFPTHSPLILAQAAAGLFREGYSWSEPVRAVSVTAISLIPDGIPVQLGLFTDGQSLERQDKIDDTVESIRSRFGNDSIRNCTLCRELKLPVHDHPSKFPGSTLQNPV